MSHCCVRKHSRWPRVREEKGNRDKMRERKKWERRSKLLLAVVFGWEKQSIERERDRAEREREGTGLQVGFQLGSLPWAATPTTGAAAARRDWEEAETAAVDGRQVGCSVRDSGRRDDGGGFSSDRSKAWLLVAFRAGYRENGMWTETKRFGEFKWRRWTVVFIIYMYVYG